MTELQLAAGIPGFELTTWARIQVGDKVATIDARRAESAGTVRAITHADGSNGPTVNALVEFAPDDTCAVVLPASGAVQRWTLDDQTTAAIRAGIIREYDRPAPRWWTAAGIAHRSALREARRIDAGRYPITWARGVAVLLGAAVAGGMLLAGAALALAAIVSN